MKLLQIIILLFISIGAFAQKVTYNYMVDSSDVEAKAVMTLFESYLASNPENQESNPYWNAEEQEKHKNYDFLESEFHPSLYMGFPVHVLSIKFINDICQIKAQFSYCKEDGSPYVLAIANYIAKKENGKYKLYNSLSYNKQN